MLIPDQGDHPISFKKEEIYKVHIKFSKNLGVHVQNQPIKRKKGFYALADWHFRSGQADPIWPADPEKLPIFPIPDPDRDITTSDIVGPLEKGLLNVHLHKLLIVISLLYE